MGYAAVGFEEVLRQSARFRSGGVLCCLVRLEQCPFAQASFNCSGLLF